MRAPKPKVITDVKDFVNWLLFVQLMRIDTLKEWHEEGSTGLMFPGITVIAYV